MVVHMVFVSSTFISKFSSALVTIYYIGTFQTTGHGMESLFVLVKVIGGSKEVEIHSGK